jgi:hypothetical protein
MKMEKPRIAREKNTISAMLKMYCHDRHGKDEGLCKECARLHAYAFERLSRCPFQLHKPTCLNCTVHCYNPEMREQVREVMRYAGPRMLISHPVLAVLHLWDGYWSKKTAKA